MVCHLPKMQRRDSRRDFYCNLCGASQRCNQKKYQRWDVLFEKIVSTNGVRKTFRGRTESKEKPLNNRLRSLLLSGPFWKITMATPHRKKSEIVPNVI